MLKKKASRKKSPPSKQRGRNRRGGAIIAALVLSLSVAGVMFARWKTFHRTLNSSSVLPQTSPSPQLSKEYIYAGGKLLATEEPTITNTATFVRTDTTTQGNWKGNYGAEGYNIINDAVSYPAYAQVSASGNLLAMWNASTSDVRALQKTASTTDRLAACWYQSSYFTIDVNITDGQTHQVALYNLDWDGNNARSQNIDIVDATTNAALDSRSVSSFSSGKYLVWKVSGHVLIHVTRTGIWNSVVSGIFFDSTRKNFALSANGSVASASSQYNSDFPTIAAINGDRYNLYMPDARYNLWHSGVGAPKPDWLQVDFNGSKSINEIDVVTMQDNFTSPVNPTETMPFQTYGLTAFEVQYWNGASWVTVPGGSVTGNDKVWRKFTFSPVTTSKVRVLISATADGYSRVMELEAWGTN
jgi:F5/8 type C domain